MTFQRASRFLLLFARFQIVSYSRLVKFESFLDNLQSLFLAEQGKSIQYTYLSCFRCNLYCCGVAGTK